jgi:hypothetical protein
MMTKMAFRTQRTARKKSGEVAKPSFGENPVAKFNPPRRAGFGNEDSVADQHRDLEARAVKMPISADRLIYVNHVYPLSRS